MRVKELWVGITVCLIIAVFARPSTAQFAPGSQADATHPSGAPDPQKEDQIWQVDPITGALNIKIPFSTTPVGGVVQRSRLRFPTIRHRR